MEFLVNEIMTRSADRIRVVVKGSRAWTDVDAIHRELARLPAGSFVIHGDSTGADTLAGQAARDLGFIIEPFRKEAADYRCYGQAAWKRLDERMVESGADLELAFHSELHEPGKAKGTKHLIGLAQARGIAIRGFTS
jgi:hypothetical protein